MHHAMWRQPAASLCLRGPAGSATAATPARAALWRPAAQQRSTSRRRPWQGRPVRAAVQPPPCCPATAAVRRCMGWQPRWRHCRRAARCVVRLAARPRPAQTWSFPTWAQGLPTGQLLPTGTRGRPAAPARRARRLGQAVPDGRCCWSRRCAAQTACLARRSGMTSGTSRARLAAAQPLQGWQQHRASGRPCRLAALSLSTRCRLARRCAASALGLAARGARTRQARRCRDAPPAPAPSQHTA